MATIGRLRAILSLNATQFDRSSDRSINKMRVMGGASDQLGRRVRGMGASMVASTVGIIGFGAALTRSIRLARDAQETQSRFNAVFRDQAEGVGAWADAYTRALGRSRAGTLDALSSFQGFFVGLNFGNEAAAGLSTTMQKLAVDFASFNNLTDEDAQGRFISALSGSSEVLARYGINTKQAAIEQELLALGVNKAWSEVTEQEKAVARLSIIYRSMSDQGALGDAVRTSESFANKQKQAAAAAENLATRIGSALLPAITPMLSSLAAVAEAIERLVSAAPGVVSAGAKFVILATAMGTAAFAAVKLVSVTGAVVASIRRIVAALEAGKAVATGGASLTKTLVGLGAAAVAFVAVGSAFADIEEQADAAATEVQELAAAEFDAAEMADELGAAMSNAADSVNGAEQQIEQLQSRLDQLSLSKLELTTKRLLEAGATLEQVSQAGALLEQIARAEERKALLAENARLQEELADAAAQVFQSTRTPLERFAQEIEKLKELFTTGLIDQDTLERAVEQAKERLNGVQDLPTQLNTGIAAVERGTAAAFSAVQQATRDQEELQRLTEIRDELREANDLIEQQIGNQPAVLIEEADL